MHVHRVTAGRDFHVGTQHGSVQTTKFPTETPIAMIGSRCFQLVAVILLCVHYSTQQTCDSGYECGTVCNGYNATDVVLPCGIGNLHSYLNSPPGFYCTKNHIEVCPRGYYCPTPSEKRVCKEGTFCPKGSWQPKGNSCAYTT